MTTPPPNAKQCPECKTVTSIYTEQCGVCGRVYKTKFAPPQPAPTPTSIPSAGVSKIGRQTPKRTASSVGVAIAVLLGGLLLIGVIKDQEPVQPLLGNVYSGVKVYNVYTNSPISDDNYVFTILGGSNNHLFDDGTREPGLKTEDFRGRVEWRRREPVITNKVFVVNRDDPARRAMRWRTYEF